MESSGAVRHEPGEDPPDGAAGDGNLLEAVEVSKVFGGLVAVDSVSFAIPRRSIVSIIGPNGAGKTTFFNMLTGLYRPTAGRITFDGRTSPARGPTGSWPAASRARSRTSACSGR